jgi:Spy/CpxP family protein refolding chaperone
MHVAPLAFLSHTPAMMKLKGLAFIAVAVFAATSAYADDKACCAAHAKNDKMSCPQTYAKLNLSPEQKVKLEKLEAQCHKAGCTKESMDKFMKSAEGILSKEQFATLKAECCKMHDKDAKA